MRRHRVHRSSAYGPAAVAQRRLKHWGWGYEDEQPSHDELRGAAAFLADRLGFGSPEPEQPVRARGRLAAARRGSRRPPRWRRSARPTPYERALHAYGRSYRDIVRAFRGPLRPPARRRRAPARRGARSQAVLDWAVVGGRRGRSRSAAARASSAASSRASPTATPASSRSTSRRSTACSRSTRSRARRASRPARLGPALEEQLAEHGLTLRHFPQSFEFSTLGGWIATRAGGHFATLYTHIDDLVESVRAVTPAGVVGVAAAARLGRRRRRPTGCCSAPRGSLGVITEAWVRVRPRPTQRASAGVRFADFAAGAEAVRALSQSGLYPTNCRLIDAGEARDDRRRRRLARAARARLRVGRPRRRAVR